MKVDLALLAAIALLNAAQAGAQDARLVSVGDHRLEVRVVGTKTPVVVIEAGFGEHLVHWRAVQDRLTDHATVVTYSRAGYGNSETSSIKPTPLHATSELRSLLRTIGADGPYVLVGHSWGGLLMRVFAAQFPEEVAGLVLVDGSHERQYQEYAKLSPTFWDDVRPNLDQFAANTGGGAPEELEVVWEVYRRGTLAEAYPLPEVPMVVITTQQRDTSWVGGTEAGRAVWRRLHQDAYAHNNEVYHIVTAQSGHNVNRDQPQLVVEAVRLVIGLRAGTGRGVF